MTEDPRPFLARLDAYASRRDVAIYLAPKDAAWILAQLAHKDAQIAALRQLVKPAPAVAAPPESVCQEAERITGGERQASYGHPIFNFTRTARIWEVILDREAGAITPEQVGLCMIGVKMARHLHKPKRDNLVDVCGFAKTVQTCADYEPNAPVDELT